MTLTLCLTHSWLHTVTVSKPVHCLSDALSVHGSERMLQLDRSSFVSKLCAHVLYPSTYYDIRLYTDCPTHG